MEKVPEWEKPQNMGFDNIEAVNSFVESTELRHNAGLKAFL